MATPPPTVVRTSFQSILLGMRTLLTGALNLDPSAVVITVLEPDDVPHRISQVDLLIRPLDEEPDVRLIDGSGRVDNRRNRTVQVVLRTHLNLDSIGQDVQRLTDSSLGHIGMEDTIVDFLECQFLTDSSGNGLLVAPMRVGKLTATKRDQREKEKGWVWSSFSVAIEYERNLDLTKGY